MAAHSLCESLRIERYRQRLSQRELATKIGTDHVVVHSWESGKQTPILTNFCAWANALGYNLELVKYNAKT